MDITEYIEKSGQNNERSSSSSTQFMLQLLGYHTSHLPDIHYHD